MSWLLSALSLTRANRVVLLLLLLRCLMCTSTGCPLLVGRYDLPCNHETTLVQAILSSIFRPLLSTAASKLKVPPAGNPELSKNPVLIKPAEGRDVAFHAPRTATNSTVLIVLFPVQFRSCCCFFLSLPPGIRPLQLSGN